MVLSADQLSNPERTLEQLKDRLLIVETAIDVQVILQLLVAKGVITREEVENMRTIVTNNDKRLAPTMKWLTQGINEINKAVQDPQWALNEMFKQKFNKDK